MLVYSSVIIPEGQHTERVHALPRCTHSGWRVRSAPRPLKAKSMKSSLSLLPDKRRNLVVEYFQMVEGEKVHIALLLLVGVAFCRE